MKMSNMITKVQKVVDTINEQLGMELLGRARVPHLNKWQYDIVVVDIAGNLFDGLWTIAFDRREIEHMDLMAIAKVRLAAVLALLQDAVAGIKMPVEPMNIQGL